MAARTGSEHEASGQEQLTVLARQVVDFIRQYSDQFREVAENPYRKLSGKQKMIVAIRATVESYFEDVHSHSTQETLAENQNVGAGSQHSSVSEDGSSSMPSQEPPVDQFWCLVKRLLDLHEDREQASNMAYRCFINFLKCYPELLLQLVGSIRKHYKVAANAGNRALAIKALKERAGMSAPKKGTKRNLDTRDEGVEQDAKRCGGLSLKRSKTLRKSAELKALVQHSVTAATTTTAAMRPEEGDADRNASHDNGLN